MSHTPGPWKINQSPDPNEDYVDISGPEHFGLAAVVWNMDGKPDEICQANARLVRAAPEMYDIILDIAGYKLLDGEYPLEAEILNKMADVLAKIRGGE